MPGFCGFFASSSRTDETDTEESADSRSRSFTDRAGPTDELHCIDVTSFRHIWSWERGRERGRIESGGEDKDSRERKEAESSVRFRQIWLRLRAHVEEKGEKKMRKTEGRERE